MLWQSVQSLRQNRQFVAVNRKRGWKRRRDSRMIIQIQILCLFSRWRRRGKEGIGNRGCRCWWRGSHFNGPTSNVWPMAGTVVRTRKSISWFSRFTGSQFREYRYLVCLICNQEGDDMLSYIKKEAPKSKDQDVTKRNIRQGIPDEDNETHLDIPYDCNQRQWFSSWNTSWETRILLHSFQWDSRSGIQPKISSCSHI